MFPNTFSEIKGIVGELEEMKIPLGVNVKLVKQRPYTLNPKYKEKFKDEFDKMLQAGIIELAKESEWTSPILIQEKKKEESYFVWT